MKDIKNTFIVKFRKTPMYFYYKIIGFSNPLRKNKVFGSIDRDMESETSIS